MKMSPLLRIACDPIARVWGGVGWLDIPADSVEPEPARYLGGGQLLQIPDLEMLLNGQASRIDITISGVSRKTVSIFKDESKTLYGALVQIGLVWFDDDWQIDTVEWLSVYTCGAPTISSKSNQNGRTRSISLSIGSDFVDRNIAPLALWTPADQARRSPDDLIFDHVPGYSTGTSRQFGPSDASG